MAESVSCQFVGCLTAVFLDHQRAMCPAHTDDIYLSLLSSWASCTFASTPPRRGRVGPPRPCPPRRHVSLFWFLKKPSFLTTIGSPLIASFIFLLLQRCLCIGHILLFPPRYFVTAQFMLLALVAFLQLPQDVSYVVEHDKRPHRPRLLFRHCVP